MIVLIDADILVYQAGYAAEASVAWDEETYTVQANWTQAQDEFDAMVAAIEHATDADKVILALSCPTAANYRRDFWPSYKAPRIDPTKRTAKPILHGKLREYAHSRYRTEERPRLEGDDVLGIMATLPARAPRVIASIDKDMQTVPGLHFNWQHGEDGVFEVKEAEARHRFFTQVLTGDSTDNYPGLPGFGAKRAGKALAGLEGSDDAAYWGAIVAAYEGKGLTEDDALVQARCARILRAEDWDVDMKEVRLWKPGI